MTLISLRALLDDGRIAEVPIPLDLSPDISSTPQARQDLIKARLWEAYFTLKEYIGEEP